MVTRSRGSVHPGVRRDRPHAVIKTFHDDTDDIEAVSIHYACTPVGELPDWDRQRATRFMPRVGPPDRHPPSRDRLVVLKLPGELATASGEPTTRYHLHHYFEVWQAGSRHDSPRFTEVIDTAAGSPDSSLDG